MPVATRAAAIIPTPPRPIRRFDRIGLSGFYRESSGSQARTWCPICQFFRVAIDPVPPRAGASPVSPRTNEVGYPTSPAGSYCRTTTFQGSIQAVDLDLQPQLQEPFVPQQLSLHDTSN